jgi:hypothetical protein
MGEKEGGARARGGRRGGRGGGRGLGKVGEEEVKQDGHSLP